jgi:hypothetical protein
VREITCWVASSSSTTPITDSSVEALTISTAVLTQGGRMRRVAWGRTTYHRRCHGLSPIALAASDWPSGIEASAPRMVSDMCAPQNAESATTPPRNAEMSSPSSARP